jgi:BirA family biotin operon repressor/biotin-[acetyl-CoA-carboxylase] ligase
VAFSIILRPRLAVEREGWVYTVAAMGLASALRDDTAIEWPDEVHRRGELAGAVAVQCGLGPRGVEWAVVSVLVCAADPSRAAALAAVVGAIEAAERRPAAELLDDYRRRCATLGRRVSARMIPLGPAGPYVTGRAVALLKDGALLVETATGRRVPIRPQNLGRLEDA